MRLLLFAGLGASGTGSVRGPLSDPDQTASWRSHGVDGWAVARSGGGSGSWSRLSSPWPVVRVAVGSWADLRAPVVAGSRGCMIPDCAYLRHGCSSPAAGGCAALGSGADAWRSRSSGRLAIRLGSPMWRILSVVHDGRLWGP